RRHTRSYGDWSSDVCSSDLIVDALMAEKNAEIAFSPGFRWGTTLLPGQTIRYEDLLDQTAITYPYVTVNELSGATIKAILEDVRSEERRVGKECRRRRGRAQ